MRQFEKYIKLFSHFLLPRSAEQCARYAVLSDWADWSLAEKFECLFYCGAINTVVAQYFSLT